MSEQRALTIAEQLALAVLRGDASAIGPMVDHLAEQYGGGGREIRPLKNTQLAQVDKYRLRAIFYVSDKVKDPTINLNGMLNSYNGWLYYGEPLVLVGIDRVEFYELPQWAADSARNTGTGAVP